MKISIVIPAFNEEKRIGSVLSDLRETKQKIIVVDDGSKDKTAQIANRYTPDVLIHRVNLGKGAALKTGAIFAFDNGADAIVLMDSDGQHKEKDAPAFMKALEDGNEVVFGSRNLNFGVPLVRYLGNKMASVFVSLLFGIYISDLLCGFRAITKRAFRKMNWESAGYGIETEMVVKTKQLGLKYCEVPVETVYYDKVKGVTILDAFGIFFQVLKWRIKWVF